MTHKEAWEKIRDRHCTHNHYCTDNCMQGEDCCEYAMALSAIEKQIPKKPIDKETEKPCLYCPSCGSELWAMDHHCKCGQALDWEEELNGE